MYVSLQEAKDQINVDHNDADDEIVRMIQEAEQYVENFINRPLGSFSDAQVHSGSVSSGLSGPDLPPPLKRAIKLYVADFWSNREAQIVGTIVADNRQIIGLMMPYRVGLGV